MLLFEKSSFSSDQLRVTPPSHNLPSPSHLSDAAGTSPQITYLYPNQKGLWITIYVDEKGTLDYNLQYFFKDNIYSTDENICSKDDNDYNVITGSNGWPMPWPVGGRQLSNGDEFTSKFRRDTLTDFGEIEEPEDRHEKWSFFGE